MTGSAETKSSDATDMVDTDPRPGLTRTERVNVQLVEAWHSVRVLSAFSTFMGRQVARRQFALIVGNMIQDHHFDRLRHANYDDGVLICASHRSYIDNFAVAVRALPHMPRDVRIIAPGRTEGLFDKPWGILLNLFLTWMNIYPPVVRSARGVPWGKRVIGILSDLLNKGRAAVFIHPEGGRNKGSDPYKLLPGRPGLGRIIHQTRAQVFPVFLQGFPRTPGAFVRANFSPGARSRPLVHAVMGEPLDFMEERSMPASPRLYSDIAQRVTDAILAAAAEEREIRARAGNRST